jgi:phosphatidylglycerol:prolipoprotein diacylglycerol transferase
VIASISLVAAIGWKVLDRVHFGKTLAVSPHGVGIAIGYLCGTLVFAREARRRGYPEEVSGSIAFWALIGTIIGARAGYVFTHLSEFHSVRDVLAIYRGGISLLGGIFGAILLSAVVVRRHKGLSFVKGLDAASIPIALGIVIGRIGDLIIGDHLGKPTSWLLAFEYRGGNLSGYRCIGRVCTGALSGGRTQTVTPGLATLRSATNRVIGGGVGVHQTALYDFGIAMGAVLLLLFLNRQMRRPGIIIATFGLWYGAGRIITDFLRVENRFFGLTGSQWTSVLIVAVCAYTLVRFALRPETIPKEPAAGSATPVSP